MFTTQTGQAGWTQPGPILKTPQEVLVKRCTTHPKILSKRCQQVERAEQRCLNEASCRAESETSTQNTIQEMTT